MFSGAIEPENEDLVVKLWAQRTQDGIAAQLEQVCSGIDTVDADVTMRRRGDVAGCGGSHRVGRRRRAGPGLGRGRTSCSGVPRLGRGQDPAAGSRPDDGRAAPADSVNPYPRGHAITTRRGHRSGAVRGGVRTGAARARRRRRDHGAWPRPRRPHGVADPAWASCGYGRRVLHRQRPPTSLPSSTVASRLDSRARGPTPSRWCPRTAATSRREPSDSRRPMVCGRWWRREVCDGAPPRPGTRPTLPGHVACPLRPPVWPLGQVDIA